MIRDDKAPYSLQALYAALNVKERALEERATGKRLSDLQAEYGWWRAQVGHK